MRKKLILIFIFGVLIFFSSSFLKNKNNDSFLKYNLNGKTYKLLIAKNPSQWQKGLMFYKSKKELKGAEGMIFIFPDKDIRSFWNKNTFLDLDVYWLDDDRIVGKDFLPSINKSQSIIIVTSPNKVNKAIEIVVN
ncbi:MAG: DUF192 domain-containing protein [Patescibacteria group bacterium]|nr:DUF192 domain-containing protein [Patescibacteria group bacterium]